MMRMVMGLWLLALALAGWGPAVEDAGAQPIVHAAHSPVQRCMNLGNALDSPEREGEWGYTIRREDLERLKAAGFDTIRVPVRAASRRTDSRSSDRVSASTRTRIGRSIDR